MLARQLRRSSASAPAHGIRPGIGDLHVIGPELGLTQPGMTIVCGDSHTSRPTARSARWRSASAPARSSTCWRRSACCSTRPKTLARQRRRASSRPGVTAKDIVLAMIAQHRHRRRHRPRHRVPRLGDPRAVDGRAHDRLQHVDRGGRAPGMIAPDDTTFAYLKGRPRAPRGAAWDAGGRRAGARCRPTTARRSTARTTLRRRRRSSR